MTVVQTVLVFVGIPLGILALIAVVVSGPALLRQPNRYRPGKAWEFPPAWYVPHPDAVVTEVPTSQRAIEGASATSTTAVGGASGEW